MWKAIQIPLFFYLELFLANILIVFFSLFLTKLLRNSSDINPTGFVSIITLLAFGFCVYRVFVRIGEAKVSNGGRFGLGNSALVLVGLLVPVLAIGAIGFKQLDGFQSKTRQSEAKIALAAVYGANKARHKEKGIYSHSLEELSYVTEGQRRFYTVGFPPACHAAEPSSGMQNTPFYEGRDEEIKAYFRSLPCRDPKEGFNAYAVGVIRKDGRLDVWTIDEHKKLQNLQNGIHAKDSWW